MLSFPFELVPVNVSTDELASFVRISLAVKVSMQKVTSLTKSWTYILLKDIFKGEIEIKCVTILTRPTLLMKNKVDLLIYFKERFLDALV